MRCSVQVIAALTLVIINDAYSRPNAAYQQQYNNAIRPQIQREVNGKTDEKYYHYDGVLVPVMYMHDSWPKQPSTDLSFGDKLPAQSAPFVRAPKPEPFAQPEDAENSLKDTDRLISKLQHLANLKYNPNPDDTRSNQISDKVYKKMKNPNRRRSKPSKVVSALKESIIKEVEKDVKMDASTAQLKDKYMDTVLKPKRVVQQRVVYTPKAPTPYNSYPLDNEYGAAYPVASYQSFRDEPQQRVPERVFDIPTLNLPSLALPMYQSPMETNPLWAKLFPAASKGPSPFLETFSTAVEYGTDSDCKQRDNQKIESLNRVKRGSELDTNEVASAQSLNESEGENKPEGEGEESHDVTNFTVIIISDEKREEDTNRADKKLDTDTDASGVLKNEILHYKDTYKDAPTHTNSLLKPLSFFSASTNKNKQEGGVIPSSREGSTGPQISTLKVRKGGVAIAGPGGIATAGSGGTAIVGPGGTAYTTADGMAVVGSGGKVVSLGAQNEQSQNHGLHVPQYQIQYQPQLSPYGVFPELMHGRPTMDYRPGLVRVNRHAKVTEDFGDTPDRDTRDSTESTGLHLLPWELILDQKPEKLMVWPNSNKINPLDGWQDFNPFGSPYQTDNSRLSRAYSQHAFPFQTNQPVQWSQTPVSPFYPQSMNSFQFQHVNHPDPTFNPGTQIDGTRNLKFPGYSSYERYLHNLEKDTNYRNMRFFPPQYQFFDFGFKNMQRSPMTGNVNCDLSNNWCGAEQPKELPRKKEREKVIELSDHKKPVVIKIVSRDNQIHFDAMHPSDAESLSPDSQVNSLNSITSDLNTEIDPSEAINRVSIGDPVAPWHRRIEKNPKLDTLKYLIKQDSRDDSRYEIVNSQTKSDTSNGEEPAPVESLNAAGQTNSQSLNSQNQDEPSMGTAPAESSDAASLTDTSSTTYQDEQAPAESLNASSQTDHDAVESADEQSKDSDPIDTPDATSLEGTSSPRNHDDFVPVNSSDATSADSSDSADLESPHRGYNGDLESLRPEKFHINTAGDFGPSRLHPTEDATPQHMSARQRPLFSLQQTFGPPTADDANQQRMPFSLTKYPTTPEEFDPTRVFGQKLRKRPSSTKLKLNASLAESDDKLNSYVADRLRPKKKTTPKPCRPTLSSAYPTTTTTQKTTTAPRNVTNLILKPMANATAGENGVALASPISHAYVQKGATVYIHYSPSAVAVAGSGGTALSKPQLVIKYLERK
ncbi:uncharacterized protein [Bemisia tabaci]